MVAVDAAGLKHSVDRTLCARCGCEQLVALDLSGAVWDAGERRQKGCGDHQCRCHTAPRRGLARRDDR